ncbi:hypothetical protein B0H17DRAFT_1209729 [Mycena rosella]|uniref:Novel STAND NTPase 1 domain-containing protein n=1 Tax=Mycena rosella TaxID=1033263 RepID=A0AAD7CZ25_MYCRO|nr:hypothetical protein B0H17DRAFT_1209729 [Mycena rosella]
MAPPRQHSIIEYTTLAASTAREIANAGVPFLGSVASLTLAILKAVETVRANKEQCIQLVDEIHTVLCAIIGIYSIYPGDGGFSPSILRDIGGFMETLQKIYSVVKSQQAMGRIKQLFKQPDIKLRLESCKAEIEQSLEKFQIQAGIHTAIETSRVQRDAKQQHEELIALIAANPDLTNSERSSSGTRTTISHSGQSTVSLALLPARPQIFHGRESELQDVIDILTQDTPARIAILGPGGMGKTALATAALHHPDIITKYTERHFISCHATATCIDLISLLADHLGVEHGAYLAKRIARFLEYTPPTLLILDNFETPWETETRPEVEEFLSTVTAVAHVALVITMRGAERPAKVKWTRPFLLPLRPLQDGAALRTFFDIADDCHDEGLVTQVLQLTGNLPLAVSLMASIVSHEGCVKTLSRWNTEKTRLLSDGYDKGSSLEISLTLSLTSSRMTPEAQNLLSLLSILPDGLGQAELLHSKLPVSNILAAKSTLVQTSLAYVDTGKRLTVLPPIREYIRGVHPPSPAVKSALRRHYHEIIDMWHTLEAKYVSDRDSVTRISENFNNLQAIMSDALSAGCQDFRQSLHSALKLDQFAVFTDRVGQRLICSFDPYLPEWGTDSVYGVYLVLKIANVSPGEDNPELQADITRGNSYFEHASPSQKVNWYNALGRYYSWLDPTAAVHWYRQAISEGSAGETSSAVAADVLCRLGDILNDTGKHAAGKICAEEARKRAEDFGAMVTEASAIQIEARCCLALGDFRYAARDLDQAKELLIACGLQQSSRHTKLELIQAEVLLLKTEYAEARQLNVRMVETAEGWIEAVTARVNIALIDIQIGGEAGPIREEIERCRALFQGPLAFVGPGCIMMCDATLVDLQLREGNMQKEAKDKLEKYFVGSRRNDAEVEIFCLQRLADISLGLNKLEPTMGWAVIFLASALARQNRLASMEALRCLGAIFLVQEENDTALSLFEVARAGFFAMGVYRSHGHCLRGMAEVHQKRGDFTKARAYLMEARPLYERCQQRREIERLDANVRDMEEALMATLAQLQVPIGDPGAEEAGLNERGGGTGIRSPSAHAQFQL